VAQNEWPARWEVRRLGEVVLPTETRDPRKDPEAMFKYVDISSVDNATFRITGYKEYRGKEAPSRARKVIRTNDVIFATTRPYLRSVAIIPTELDGEICSTGFCVLRSNGMADPQWLFALARSDIVVDPVVKTMRGANYPAVTDRDVLAVEIPLPPLDEQRRIVARIEELMQRIEELRRLHEESGREIAAMSGAVLAKAFRGELLQ
jgi:type I restriction enzyme S subunit